MMLQLLVTNLNLSKHLVKAGYQYSEFIMTADWRANSIVLIGRNDVCDLASSRIGSETSFCSPDASRKAMVEETKRTRVITTTEARKRACNSSKSEAM